MLITIAKKIKICRIAHVKNEMISHIRCQVKKFKRKNSLMTPKVNKQSNIEEGQTMQ